MMELLGLGRPYRLPKPPKTTIMFFNLICTLSACYFDGYVILTATVLS